MSLWAKRPERGTSLAGEGAPVNTRALLAVGMVAAALCLGNLGRAPFIDPPEGTHTQIAWEMLRGGDWITPHLDGVPYFDKPPLLYWLLAISFALFGPSEWVARLWSALPAVGVAVLTARIGMRLGSARVGLLAGLMVVANLEMFVFGRLVKPDLLFVFVMLLALSAFIDAYLGGGRAALFRFYGSLGLAVLAKDILGALGPLAVLVLFLYLTRERQAWAVWAPWGGVALFLVLTVPWHALMEWKYHGFLWYSIVDNHVLNFLGRRVFPDEDVPLSALEFAAVTAAGFFPWVLILPWALGRVLGRVATTASDRMWLLLAVWTIAVLGCFLLAPFKLPHYGLPAFPAMALLTARLSNEVFERAPGAPSPRALLVAPLATLAALAVLSLLAWWGALTLPAGALSAADMSTRTLAARGQEVSAGFLHSVRSLFGTLALVFGLGAVGITVGMWRRHAVIGVGTMLAVMMAFLPVSAEGLRAFARSRSATVMTETVVLRARADDILAHEGPIEDSASWLLGVGRPVQIVDGRRSSLAFGSTFPSARGVFWDAEALARAWRGERRVFLLSVVRPPESVVQHLPGDRVHLLVESGGRWLYSNRP